MNRQLLQSVRTRRAPLRGLLRGLLRAAAVLLLPLSLMLALTSCGASENAGEGGSAVCEQTETAADSFDADPDTEVSEAATIESVIVKAQELSGQYGVQILCGSDVPLQYADYTVETLDDPEKIDAALEELNRTLAIYPPGFFTSVKEGYRESITICLAKNLRAVNDGCVESAHAFTTVEKDSIWLVLDADMALRSSTLIHELTHVIDYRLLGMNQMQESEWNLLNPPSFAYYNAYLDENGTDYRISGSKEYTAYAEEDPENIWFYDPYSKTFAMEDRARLMELLLQDTEDEESPDRTSAKKCFSSPHVQAKLRFYFYTLRQAFGNARWPEETVWEEALQKAID